MDFSFSEEQMMLKDSIADFLRDGYSFESYHQIVASQAGYSPEIWRQFAELQWQGLPFAEDEGGLGYDSTELLLLAEEMGRGLCIEPYMANVVLAGSLIAALGGAEDKQALLGGLIDGSLQISLAHAELAGRNNPAHCAARAAESGANWKLSGHKSVVLNAANADKLLVVARSHGDTGSREGQGVFVVDAKATGLTMQRYALLGGGVGAEVKLDRVEAQRLGDEAMPALEDSIDLATAYGCAEAYGAMQALLAKTVEYSQTRKQFGAPLASFQVLQHRMVDMFIEVQQSQSMLLMLMLRLTDEDRGERQKAVSATKAYLHKASKFVAQQAVQLHGGIGVTEELDIGHYFRRLTAFGNLYGGRVHHLRRYAALTRGDAVASAA